MEQDSDAENTTGLRKVSVLLMNAKTQLRTLTWRINNRKYSNGGFRKPTEESATAELHQNSSDSHPWDKKRTHER